MKKLLFIVGLFFFFAPANAQYNPVTSMQNDFKDIATFSKQRKQSGFEGLQSYSSGDVKGSQFFFPAFADGSVTTTNNEVISTIYQFLFDKVRQELFIISKGDKKQPPEVLQADKDQIKSFTITTDKDHLFVPAHKYLPENITDFYEVLKKNDSAYTLLKYVKTTFVKNDTRDIAKMKRGDFYDEFVDESTYYISFKTGTPQQVKLKRSKIIDAFPASEKQVVEEYIKNHEDDKVDEQFLIALLVAINK
jgi:hypothetical protein